MIEHDPNAKVLVLTLTAAELQQRLANRLATMSADDFQEVLDRGGAGILRQLLYPREVSIRQDGKGNYVFTDLDYKGADSAKVSEPT